MPKSFAIFMACWIVLGLASWLFYKKASYESKRMLHPLIVIGSSVMFIAFVEAESGGKVPWFFIAFVALIAFLNLRNIRFCPQCGATLQQGFSRPKFCSKCGSEL